MFVFPMLGTSRRFFEAGYSSPKYMLPLAGATVFHHVVRSFERYWHEDDFLFICRNDVFELSFVKEALTDLGVSRYRIIPLNGPTMGQAHTVYLGLNVCSPTGTEEIFVFNIDTLRPGFLKPSDDLLGDAYLEVFHGEGSHWSFVLPGAENIVLKTTEKDRISDLCSDGLYYFRSKSIFDKSFAYAQAGTSLVEGEYYIAPLYNHLIDMGFSVKYGIVSTGELFFCGTPKEYELLMASSYPLKA